MTLRADLIPVVDDARAVVAGLGLRRYTVAVRTRVWSGGKIGSGDPTDTDATITPAPKVERLPVRLIANSGGIYEEGDLLVSKISASYAESNLVAAPSAGTETLWILNGESFRAVTRPETKNFEWKVVVRRMNRPRDS